MKRNYIEAVRMLGVEPAAVDGVLDDLQFAVFVDHTELGCIYTNLEALRMFEMSWEEFQGFGWAQAVHPGDMETLREAIERYELTKETIDVRYRVKLRDGSLRALHVVGKMVLDARGEQLGSMMVARDVTSERALQERVIQGQKLEAIGRLAGRVAHDFNNVLTPILCAASLLEFEELSDEGREHLETIVQGVQHAAGITRQLLGLSRQESLTLRAVSLDQEVEALRPLLVRLLGEEVRLELDLASQGAAVSLAAHELGQVVLNLCTIGRDAMAGVGRIRVATRQQDGQCTLVVEDSGPGIPVEVQQRMFDPFFTTKPADRGTGLGLSTVQSLATRAGGTVSVQSELGRPTRLTVTLPCIATTPAELHPDPAGVSLEPMRVLIVDDNAPLRQTLAYVLALRGHKVKSAASCRRGLELLSEQTFDVLVSDVLLPDGRGDRLAAEARAAQPELLVVFMSGYAGPDFHQSVLDQAHTTFLQKPFHPNRLIAALGEVLDDRRRSVG